MKRLTSILTGCLIFNYAVLIFWFILFLTAHDALYAFHIRYFNISPESFDTIHYGGMAIYKIGILLFDLSPLIAILCCPRTKTKGDPQ